MNWANASIKKPSPTTILSDKLPSHVSTRGRVGVYLASLMSPSAWTPHGTTMTKNSCTSKSPLLMNSVTFQDALRGGARTREAGLGQRGGAHLGAPGLAQLLFRAITNATTA
eukprot:2806301-Pyramimonas_sp.AAC.1